MPLRAVLLSLVWTVVSASLAHSDDVDARFFAERIRPILSNRCFACHGPDEEGAASGLRLDQRDRAIAEADSGVPAIVPGHPEKGELLRRVTSDDEFERMPPTENGAALTAKEIADLKTWIASGAPYARHWSYVVPLRPAVPAAVGDAEIRNPVDAFVVDRLSAAGLQQSPMADRRSLARRLALDLTGLPLTPDEVDAFAADRDPHAYERLVDHLLARPMFGEHWARKWLDLARYADSAGYADDPPRTIWAWRDWVIRSMNRNQPFDQFTIEQLAGDLLEHPTPDQLIATAFHRNTLTNNEGGTQDEEFRNVAVVDRVNTTMAVWMGTTMACAQCHTHKYDPITQEEYFRFFAVFNNTADADRRNESPTVDVMTEEQQARRRALEEKRQQLNDLLARSTPELEREQVEWERRLNTPSDWVAVSPAAFAADSGASADLSGGRIRIKETTAAQDVYRIRLPADAAFEDAAAGFRGIRLETIPDAAYPGGGAGFGGGNFVVTEVSARWRQSSNELSGGRYVRLELPGSNRILSVAEVEVLAAGANLARNAKASQSSVDYGGPASLAVDGNTDGNYDAKSVTHTRSENDPWWELDLQQAASIEEIRVYNRTDNNLQARLSGLRVIVLDGERRELWKSAPAQSPGDVLEFVMDGSVSVMLRSAYADYEQPGFEAGEVLDGKAGSENGWAVGGGTKSPHRLDLFLKKPVGLSPGAELELTVRQESPYDQHVLGQFRVLVTSDPAAEAVSRIPIGIRGILRRSAAERSADESETLADYYRRFIAPALEEPRRELQQTEKLLADIRPATTVPVMAELPDNKRRTTHLQYRGSYLARGPEVQPGVPEIFLTSAVADSPDRLDVARWLVSSENPLTARVTVNRYWESLFGRGIVGTSEEFGSQGDLPTHAELLDWLATEFMESGWDRKHILKTIVMSATYRQQSDVTDQLLVRDSDNRLLSRGPRVRLTAEMVRDQALFVAGLLSEKMYGPPVKPPQPDLGLKAAFGGSTDWKASTGENRYRRGLYTTWRRSNPYPSMAAFDAPNREVCTVRRNSTNTPLQSLVTLNDPVYIEAAQALARQMLKSSTDPDACVNFGLRRALQRVATREETTALSQLYSEMKTHFAEDPSAGMALATDPLGPLPEGMMASDAAAMTVVANVILNLDEMFLKP